LYSKSWSSITRLFGQFLRQEFGIEIPSNPLADIYWLVAAAQPEVLRRQEDDDEFNR
jgi:hypothetical protein